MPSKREAKRRALVKFLDRLPANRGEKAHAPQVPPKKAPPSLPQNK